MDESQGQGQEPPATTAVHRLTEAMKKPATAATVVGGLALGAVVVFGFAEVMLGAGAAYLAYRLIKKPSPPK